MGLLYLDIGPIVSPSLLTLDTNLKYVIKLRLVSRISLAFCSFG